MSSSHLFLSCGALFFVAALADAAHAEGPSPAPPRPPAVVFPTLASDGLANHATVQLGWHRLDDGSSLERVQLDAAFSDPTGFGGYASASIVLGDGGNQLGNAEFGGSLRLRGTASDTVLRLGLVLPLSSSGEDGLFTLASTALSRPSDILAAGPGYTVARLAVAPTFRVGRVTLRGDTGFDLPLDAEGSPPPWLHLDLAGAVQVHQVVFTAEVQTALSIDPDREDRYHLFAISVQRHVRRVAPFLTLSMPQRAGVDLGATYNLFAGLRFGT